MELSRRIQQLTASPIRKLAPYAEAAKSRGVKVYHLNIGQPDIATSDVYFKAIREAKLTTVAYTNSQGEKPLREAISKYYAKWNIPYSPEEIIVTHGGTEALIIAMLSVCDPGDEILVFEPYYANYSSLAKAFNVTPRAVATDPETGYHLPDDKTILASLTDKTKLVILTNPGNPTGSVYTADELKRLAKIVKDRGLFVLADEVYREFVYEGSYTSMASFDDIRDQVLIVDSVSKRYSACGARIGALLSHNKELIAQSMKYCQARLCVPSLEQIGAEAMYLHTADTYLKSVNDEYRHRRDTLHEALMAIPGVKCPMPSGAFYMMVTLPVDDSEKFAKWLLEEFQDAGETVMLAPGAGFYGTPGKGVHEARVAYVLKEADLLRAAELLKKALAVYPGRTC